MCCDVINDREYKGFDLFFNILDVFFDLLLFLLLDFYFSVILDDQLFFCFYDFQGLGDLFDDLLIICGIFLCNIGMKIRK